MNQKNDKKRNKARIGIPISVLGIIILIGLCTLGYSGYRILQARQTYDAAEASYDEVRDVIEDKGPAGKPYVPEEIETVSLPEGRFEWEDAYDEGIEWDYEALHALNPDIIGYIKCRGDGAIVNYPVVQGQDNDYYLDHMFDGSYNHSGAIFMDAACTEGFEAGYSVIYGHNMQSGSRMFGYLKQYDNSDAYYPGHSEYDIWTKDRHYVYRVIATYVTHAISDAYKTPLLAPATTMTDEEKLVERTRLLDKAFMSNTTHTGDQSAVYSDKSNLIALSTCYGGYGSAYRYIVLLARDREVVPGPGSIKVPEEGAVEDSNGSEDAAEVAIPEDVWGNVPETTAAP